MDKIFEPDFFDTVTATMAVLAVIVFIALHRINAGYGINYTPKWGPSISNRTGWVIMEAPAFICMAIIWAISPRASQAAPCVMALLYELHYFQRSFIFPFLMRGKSKMPWAIIIMGMTFNTVNAYMIGGWIFMVSPPDLYRPGWLLSPLFILGTLIFFTGMAINLHSDNVIRHLRQPGDTRHYIPKKGMYRYVIGANYFGEFIEWTGFAILSWSIPGAVFALWTFANLAPRARSLHERYSKEFGKDFDALNLRYILPFIY